MPLFKVSLESQVPVSAIVVSQAPTEQAALEEVRFLQSRARVNWSRGATKIGAIEAPYDIWAHPRPEGGWNVSLSALIPISHAQSIAAEDQDMVTQSFMDRQASGLIPWKYRGVPIGEYKDPISTFWSNQLPDVVTGTNLVMSANIVYPGQSVQMSVDISGDETPVGSMIIKDVSAGGRGVIVYGPLEPDSVTAGLAHSSVSVNLAEGTYSIVAAYDAPDGYLASESDPQTLTITKVPTTTVVAPPDSPILTGQQLQLQVSITQEDPTAPTPTGTVTLFLGGVVQFTTALDGSARASIPLGTLSVGTYSYTVHYDGDDVHVASSAAVPPITVELVDVQVAVQVLDSGLNGISSSVYSQPIRVRVTVDSLTPLGSPPSGSVNITKDSVSWQTVSLTQVSSTQARADYVVDSLTPASLTFGASYSGNSTYGAASAPSIPFTVQKANVQVNLSDLNSPTVVGQSASYQASVSVVAPATKSPFDVYGTSGQVQFSDVGSDVVNFNGSGVAARSKQFTQAGSLQTTASFQSTSLFNAGQSSVTHVVDKAQLTGHVTFSANPVAANASFTMTATVNGAAPGSAVGSGGRVDFSLTDQNIFGETYLGGATAVGGQAALTLVNPAIFSDIYQITVSYTGDSNIAAGSFQTSVLWFGSIL